ncbi:MAG: hypothetical protein V1728_05615 [Candidatus Micrarchaeota archaeon]
MTRRDLRNVNGLNWMSWLLPAIIGGALAVPPTIWALIQIYNVVPISINNPASIEVPLKLLLLFNAILVLAILVSGVAVITYFITKKIHGGNERE